jgi:hypothetical protein
LSGCQASYRYQQGNAQAGGNGGSGGKTGNVK